MPPRRAPFSYGLSDGDTTGAAPSLATPLSGTGTDGAASTMEIDQIPGALPAETPASLRRRIMPIAGSPHGEPDVLQIVQQLIAQRRGGQR